MSASTISRYANDPRVTDYYPQGDDREGYTVVTDDGNTYHVLYSDVFNWVICHPTPNLDFVQVEGGPSGLAIGLASADGAISVLIGDPVEG